MPDEPEEKEEQGIEKFVETDPNFYRAVDVNPDEYGDDEEEPDDEETPLDSES